MNDRPPTVSGLEYLRQVAAGSRPGARIAEIAGIGLVSAEVGEVVIQAVATERWLNTSGDVHGGWLCTQMDSAMGLAVISTLSSLSSKFVTIELKVSFLRPVVVGGEAVQFTGRTLRVGRRVAFAEAHARLPDGTLVGHASSSLARVEQSSNLPGPADRPLD